MPELEHKTRHAIHLGHFHRSSSCALHKSRSWQVNAANAISDIHFLPGHDNRLLLTSSKGIWCQITCWDMYPERGLQPKKLCEWEPKSTVFLGIAVNTDPRSSVQLAVGITRNEFVLLCCYVTKTEIGFSISRIDLMSLSQPLTSKDPQFRLWKPLSCVFRPITLEGDLLAASDDYVQTMIYNWQTGAEALLKSSENSGGSSWEVQSPFIFLIRSIDRRSS